MEIWVTYLQKFCDQNNTKHDTIRITFIYLCNKGWKTRIAEFTYIVERDMCMLHIGQK